MNQDLKSLLQQWGESQYRLGVKLGTLAPDPMALLECDELYESAALWKKVLSAIAKDTAPEDVDYLTVRRDGGYYDVEWQKLEDALASAAEDGDGKTEVYRREFYRVGTNAP